MAHLCSVDFSYNDLINILQQYQWTEDACLMAFTPAEARFKRFSPADDVSFLSSTESGRIFSPSGELVWRRMERNLRATYLGNIPPPNFSDYTSQLDSLSPYKRRLLLWGVRFEIENEWLEQQVPHRFTYPIDTTEYPRGRAALIVEDWKDAANIPRFSRYHSVIEVKGENGHASK